MFSDGEVMSLLKKEKLKIKAITKLNKNRIYGKMEN